MSINIDSISGNFTLYGNPDTCPYCKAYITPIPIYAYRNHPRATAFFMCPNTKCNTTFLAEYLILDKVFQYLRVKNSPTPNFKNFQIEISELSPDFIKIYNEAYQAEQMGLSEICGAGYRKALEFLIKDYSKKKFPKEVEKIQSMLLGKVIDSYIPDDRVKNMAKRAAWLGNDEVHYIKKWENKDLTDLKNLIDLTVHWILMEILSESYENSMEGK